MNGLAGLIAPGPRLSAPAYAANAAWRRGVTNATVDGATITGNTHSNTTLDTIVRSDGGAALVQGAVYYIIGPGIAANTLLTVGAGGTSGTLSNAATSTTTGGTFTLEQSNIMITGSTTINSTNFGGIAPQSMINGSVVNITGPNIPAGTTLTITSSGGNSGTLSQAATATNSGTFFITDPYPLGFASRIRAMVQSTNVADSNGVIGSNTVNASIVGQMNGGNSDGGKPLHEAPVANLQRQPVFYYNTFPSMPSDNLPAVWKSGQTMTIGAGNSFYGQSKYWMQVNGFLNVPVPLSPSGQAFNVAYRNPEMAGTDHIWCVSDRLTNPPGEMWATWKFVYLNINTFVAHQSTWLPSGTNIVSNGGTNVINVGTTTADLAPGSAPTSVGCSGGTTTALVQGQYITVGTSSANAVVFVVASNTSASATSIPVTAGAYYSPSSTSVLTTLPNDVPSGSSIQMQQVMPPIGYLPPNGDGWYYGFGYGEYLGSATKTPNLITSNLPLYQSGSGLQNTTLTAALTQGTQVSLLSVAALSTAYTVNSFLQVSDPTIPIDQVFQVSQAASVGATTVRVQTDTVNHTYASGTTVVAGDLVGAAACDFPQNAGRITYTDIMRGYIDHAISFESGCGGPVFVIPAHRGDSTGANTANTSQCATTGTMPAGTYNGTTNPIPLTAGTTHWLPGSSNLTINGVVFTTTSSAVPSGSTTIPVVNKTTAADLSGQAVIGVDMQYEIPEGGWYRIKPSWVMPAVGTQMSLAANPELQGAHFGQAGFPAGSPPIIDQIHIMIWTAMQTYGFYVTDGTKGTSFICNLQHPSSLDTEWSKTSLAAYNAQVLKIAPNCSLVQTANGQSVQSIGGSGTANKNPIYAGPFLLDSNGQPCIQKLVWGSW